MRAAVCLASAAGRRASAAGAPAVAGRALSSTATSSRALPLTILEFTRSSGQSGAAALAAAAALALVVAGASASSDAPKPPAGATASKTSASSSSPSSSTSTTSKHLPVYTRKEVSAHNTPEARVWVTYQGRVYDVTDFIPLHPGGTKLLLAAGGPLEPFWALYAQHSKDYVKELLARYLIGTLDPTEASAIAQEAAAAGDPYAADPARHPALVARSLRPYNGETPPEVLADAYLTPQELLFTRNHLPVPSVDAKTFRLVIDGVPAKVPKAAPSSSSSPPSSSSAAAASPPIPLPLHLYRHPHPRRPPGRLPLPPLLRRRGHPVRREPPREHVQGQAGARARLGRGRHRERGVGRREAPRRPPRARREG